MRSHLVEEAAAAVEDDDRYCSEGTAVNSRASSRRSGEGFETSSSSASASSSSSPSVAQRTFSSSSATHHHQRPFGTIRPTSMNPPPVPPRKGSSITMTESRLPQKKTFSSSSGSSTVDPAESSSGGGGGGRTSSNKEGSSGGKSSRSRKSRNSTSDEAAAMSRLPSAPPVQFPPDLTPTGSLVGAVGGGEEKGPDEPDEAPPDLSGEFYDPRSRPCCANRRTLLKEKESLIRLIKEAEIRENSVRNNQHQPSNLKGITQAQMKKLLSSMDEAKELIACQREIGKQWKEQTALLTVRFEEKVKQLTVENRDLRLELDKLRSLMKEKDAEIAEAKELNGIYSSKLTKIEKKYKKLKDEEDESYMEMTF